ncbi:MAG TPA: tetratricopeptide repeat protein, partial [Methanofastidiosum sp.]|nr:tetratricopeptide repeat protein [Methanofastidiosum sp.]
GLYRAREQYEEAEFYFKKGLIILEKVFGTNNPDVAMAMLNLAEMYESQGRTDEAKRYSESAKSIFKKTLKSD